MNLTGEALITCLTNTAEANGKIFFQTEKDEVNAERLVKFFAANGGAEVAQQCVERFIRNEKQPVIFLLDFVVKIGTIVEEIKIENQDREEFKRLVRQTQERMKGDNN